MNGEERQHRRRDLRKGEVSLPCHDLATLFAITAPPRFEHRSLLAQGLHAPESCDTVPSLD